MKMESEKIIDIIKNKIAENKTQFNYFSTTKYDVITQNYYARYRVLEDLLEEIENIHMTIRCKICGTTIKGDKKGHLIVCECGKCAIDETQYYARLIGEPENYEILEDTRHE